MSEIIKALTSAYPEWAWAEEGGVTKGVKGGRRLEVVQQGDAWRVEGSDRLLAGCGIHEDLIVAVVRAIYNTWHNK